MKPYLVVASLFLVSILSTLASAQPPDFARLQTVLRTLDVNGDQSLATDEIQQATQRLLALDADGDGALSLEEMGGPAPIRGMIRQQYVVRALDEDGDLSISAEELSNATASLGRLDHDGDWILSREELDLPDPDGPTAGGPPAAPPGGMSLMRRMNAYPSEITGDILPGSDSRAFDGYMLVHDAAFSWHNANRIYLVDGDGETVHEWESAPYQPEGSVAYLLENGLLLRTASSYDWIHSEEYPVGAAGTVQLLDWDSNVVWEYEMDVPGKHVIHHDVDYMPNGNILAIAYTAFSLEEARAMGWDAEYPQDVDTIWLDKIVELRPDLDDGSTELVWQWNSWDHLVQDAFPDRANFGDVESAIGKIDINYLRDGYTLFNRGQLHHVNSVDYNPQLDQIVLSSATYGELWFIDHSTTMTEAAGDSGGRYGRGGDLIYRWGNPLPTKSGSLDDATLYWQHDVHWISDGLPGAGNIAIYNNGTKRNLQGRHDPELFMDFQNSYTELLEVRFERDGIGRYDADSEPEIVWSWNSDAGEDYYSPFMSGYDRLPNGNTIFVNAHNKRIIEVTTEGERVLDYRIPHNGRMYRVYKYPRDYPGFSGRLL